MKKDKIGFLILHYYAFDETVNCVKSIKEKIDVDDYEIVIVDNCSLNGSGNLLYKKYKNDRKVTVILNKENLGFANGNNVGFKYLKNNLGCNYIVMLNNDVLLLSDNIFKNIKDEYHNTNFAVMGPKIYDINNNLPYFNKNLLTVNKLRFEIIYILLLFILACCNLLGFLCKLLKRKRDEVCAKSSNCNDGIRKENVLLHGCCLIFSPTYIEKFDGIDDRTFLYREEEFLYLRIKNSGMISLYNPNIEIKHLEDVSTNKSMPDFNKRRRIMYSHHLKSSKLLLKELKKYK